MKTSKSIVLVMMLLALGGTSAMAQRGGGSRGGGSSSHSVSSSSRSSSSSSSRSSMSSPSRSSSSSSRSSSVSSSPRSSSSSSTRSSVGSSPRSSSSVSSGRSSVDRSSAVRAGSTSSRSVRSGERTTTTPHSGVRGREAAHTRDVSRSSESSPRSTASRREGTRGVPAATTKGPAGATGSHGGPVSDRSVLRDFEGHGYARPDKPGGHMPPAAHPIHPAPYFHHPWHGYMVHCHPIFWDPIPPRPWYWPGFWVYCNNYWYDYHVTDVTVVRRYVQDTYHVDMITYGISGDIMYAIVRDGGSTYLQVYDKDDHLLAEQKINKKYCNMVIDSENGGCWISKKKNKDPLLFLWADGQLLIYEAD